MIRRPMLAGLHRRRYRLSDIPPASAFPYLLSQVVAVAEVLNFAFGCAYFSRDVFVQHSKVVVADELLLDGGEGGGHCYSIITVKFAFLILCGLSHIET